MTEWEKVRLIDSTCEHGGQMRKCSACLEIALFKDVERLTAEINRWRERFDALQGDHERTYEAYVALLNELGRLNPLAIKKVPAASGRRDPEDFNLWCRECQRPKTDAECTHYPAAADSSPCPQEQLNPDKSLSRAEKEQNND